MRNKSNWTQWNGTDIEWDTQLLKFAEPCAYQNSSWGNHRIDFGWRILRLIDSSQSSCIAQVLVKTKFGTTIAWVPGGPVGDLARLDEGFDETILKLTDNSRLYIRINLLNPTNSESQKLLEANDWKSAKNKFSTGVSLDYSLQTKEPSRRDLLSTNWGRNLRRGETRNIEPYIWKTYSAEEIASVYHQLNEYKDLEINIDTPSLETISSLIKNCRPNLVLVRCDDSLGNPLAIRGALCFGTKAWDIFAAVTPVGRKQYSSYVTAWKLFDECVNLNFTNYDLSGVDPINNKGVYDFKKGTGAKEVTYLGEWDRGAPFFIAPLAGRLIGYLRNT
jgi:FemAB family